MKKNILPYIPALSASILLSQVALAEDIDYAKELANPVASLISVETDANYNDDIGDDNGSQWITNFANYSIRYR